MRPVERPARGVRLAVETLESRALLSATTAVQSGDWDSPGTWSAGVPDDTLRAIIPSGLTVTLTGTDHVAEEIVVQGVLDVEESPGVTKTLTADWVHVNSGGVFQIGTLFNRYDENDFVLTLTGTDPTEVFTVEGAGTITDNNGFLMAASGGRLQFFGEEKLTFTKLAATAEAGADQILVEAAIDRDHDGDIDFFDGSLDWGVGDQIVVASSTRDYADEEVRDITAIADQGNGTFLITLDAALNERHYGEVERYTRDGVRGDFNGDGVVDLADYTVYRDNLGAATENAISGMGDGVGGVTSADYQVWRDNLGATAGPDFRTWEVDMRAEVAVLNRNVRIQGLASEDTDNAFGDRARFDAGLADGFGGHIMIMGSAGQITVSGVQLDRMGQTARLGRYPIHWHLAGDRAGDILQGVSITNSNNRGVTVHGTHNLLIQDVVLHDVHGHGFFMEDAVETGNQYIANIAFGIHQVGSFGPDGPSQPNLGDPFIVDTHDHVGQNPLRFLSSAAYWMTNPDNTWVGNVSAGSAGTGFWFLFPDSAIGLSASDPQYAGVQPERVNLGQFDYNSSHSSPVGLNFDRGSDIEGPVGATLLDPFDGNAHIPTAEPQIFHYTGYQHTTGIYHRARIGNFEETRLADNFTGTFITFTQRITDSLYVGHSRGNSDPGEIVTGHTFYDGANTLDGTHFAGFTASNAHMFRTNGVATRHTHFVMRNTSFEDDGSADNLRYSDVNGQLTSYSPVGKTMPSVIYDEDGTLTAHVGGGAGSTVIPDHPFFYDTGDFQAPGWNTRISDDHYAVFRMRADQNPVFRVTTPDGDTGQDDPGTGLFAGTNTLMKQDAGDYEVDFPGGVGGASDGFDILYFVVNGPDAGSTVVKFTDMAAAFSVSNRPLVADLNTVRNATETSWTRDGDDIYVKFFSAASETDRVAFVPGVIGPPIVLWEDTAPPTSSFGTAVTAIADPFGTGMGTIGRWVTNGQPQFKNINPAGPALNVSAYDGFSYVLSFDYYVDSTQPLTDDVFYTNVYSADSFTTIGVNAMLDAWTTVTSTGTIDTSGGSTVEPLIIVNHQNTTETTPSLYIDNINFSVFAPASVSMAGAVAPASPEVPTSAESSVGAALVGVDLSASLDFTGAALLIDDRAAVRRDTAGDEAFALLEEDEDVSTDSAMGDGLDSLGRLLAVS